MGDWLYTRSCHCYWLGFQETSKTHYLEGSSATYASQVFNSQASGILPQVKQAQFPVADAYATGGKVVDSNDSLTGGANLIGGIT